jgi:8-oxo-dGTP diphosphatase
VKTVVVAAAVIERGDRVFVTRRHAGAHLGGLWEFPGGKCEPGESLRDCLARELQEELGVSVTDGGKLLETTYSYADRQIELHFFSCDVATEPRPVLGQEMRWIDRRDLASLDFPPADAELVRRLSGERPRRGRPGKGRG